MRKRFKVSRKRSKKMFRRGARVKRMNIGKGTKGLKRGGTRM